MRPVWRPFHRSVLSPNSDRNEWRCAETFGYLSEFLWIVLKIRGHSLTLIDMGQLPSRTCHRVCARACSIGCNVDTIKRKKVAVVAIGALRQQTHRTALGQKQ